MEKFAEWFTASFSGQPDYNLILRFLEVLVWPSIVLLGMLMVRPWRLIDAMIANGGELALPGGAIKLTRTIAQAAERLEVDEDSGAPIEEPDAVPPNASDADAYQVVMNGWSRVIMGLESAMHAGGLGKVSKINPMETVDLLRRKNLIGRKLAKSAQELWDVRNKVKRAGSSRLDKIGFAQDDADAYYIAAERLRRGIGRAIALRENRGDLVVSSAARPKSSIPEDTILN